MATEVGSLYYDLNIDDKALNAQLASADKSVKTFGDHVSAYWGDSVKASKQLLMGVAAVGAATVAFGVSSVKAFNESQMMLTQLDAVLKSTGSAAGVTRDSAIALSREIQKTTSLSDEAALAVENMGLTFTKIGKDIFPTATKAAIDMATAMNHGMKPSAEQAADSMKLLGKALQDPDAGLGALHRVGVNTDELKKKFEGISDVATKQKMILAELGTEFGGSAAAQAKTFSGRIDQMKNAFNDLQEQVGSVIVKALGPVADALSRVIDRVTQAGGLLQVVTNLWKGHKETIIVVAGALAGALLPAVIAITVAFGAFLLTLAPWAALGAGITYAFIHWGDTLKTIGGIIMMLRPEIIALAVIFGTLAAAMAISTMLDAIIMGFNTLMLITIPGLIATVETLQAVLSGGLSIAIGGVILAVGILIDHFFRHTSTTQDLKNAQDALTASTNAMAAAQDAAAHADLNLQGAQLQVESAQRSYNQAVSQFGPNSLEARQALQYLREAQLGVKDAQDQATASHQKLLDQEHKVAADKSLIVHLQDTSNNLDNISNKALTAGSQIQRLNGTKVTVKTTQGPAGNAVVDFVSTFGRAAGGPVAGGMPYMVGEQGKELFFPNVDGFIMKASDTMDYMKAIAGNKSKTTTSNRYGDTIVNIGEITNQQDADYVLRRLDRNSQLESMGASPA